MRRGFVIGAVLGAALSLAVGVCAAVLPSTPTWALWRLKTAIDQNDARELSEMVNIAEVTQRAVTEMDGSPDGLNLAAIAATVLSGGKVVTVFNDPDKPLNISGGEVLAAWWSMRRDGDLAYVTLPAGDRPVDLILGNDPRRGWRIVGITPMAALIRVVPRAVKGKTAGPVSSAVDARRDEG